ncbi:Nn.00g074160.m01.CDS01 [Neocucurbitaria sp. VM-36]
MSNPYSYTPPTSDPRYRYTVNSNTSSPTSTNSYSSNVNNIPLHGLPGETKPDTKPPEWPTRPKQNSQRNLTNVESADASRDGGHDYDIAPATVVPRSYQQHYSGNVAPYTIAGSNDQTGSVRSPQQSLPQHLSSPRSSIASSQYSHQYSSTSPYVAARGYDSPMHNDERDEEPRTFGIDQPQDHNERKASEWSEAKWSEQYQRYYRTRIDEQGTSSQDAMLRLFEPI